MILINFVDRIIIYQKVICLSQPCDFDQREKSSSPCIADYPLEEDFSLVPRSK